MDGNALPPLPTAGHRHTLERLCTEAIADRNVCGVLLCGSCARGDALPGSDLDLRVFLRDGIPPRPFAAQTSPEGVFVEISCRTPDEARERLETRPMEVYAYREGRVLYDPEQSVADLCRRADARFTAYRAPADAKAGMHYWLESALRKIDTAIAAGENERAAFVATTTSWPLLEGLFLAADMPQPPSGAVRSQLEKACHRAGHGLTVSQMIGLWDGETSTTRIKTVQRVIRTLLPLLSGDSGHMI